jgi:DNA-directed RNA polymerase subunit RPC12/RpoP
VRLVGRRRPVSLGAAVLRCIECSAETDRFEPGWRTLLSFDPDQDTFEEAVSYCPECSVREFDFPSRVSPRD